MRHAERQTPPSHWLHKGLWDTCAQQALQVRVGMLIGVALIVQALTWGLWFGVWAPLRNEPPAVSASDHPAPTAWTADDVHAAQAFAQWMTAIRAAAAVQDPWIDMALHAEHLGLTVIQPLRATETDAAPTPSARTAWVVQGALPAALQWLTDMAIEQPHAVVNRVEWVRSDDTAQVTLTAEVQPYTAVALDATHAQTLPPSPTLLAHWQARLQPLSDPAPWPVFDNLPAAMDPPWLSAGWPKAWPPQWQATQRHVLATHALTAIVWRGALLSRGRTVALVEAGAEVWMVEPGDILGLGRHRVVRITPDTLVLQQWMPNSLGADPMREWVWRAPKDRAPHAKATP